MDTPKIIIYMSCYNHEPYVREAMDSILQQTYTNWELYVVNDGSKDRTGEILAEYKDERIHFYDFKENTAFVGASNFLHNIVRDIDAKYITTFSSDDKWEVEKLEKQVRVLEAHPEYKCCFTWDKLIFNTEEDTYKNLLSYSHKKNRSRYEWLKYYFEYTSCMNACSALMHKDTFYELGGMNQVFRQLADFRLWTRLACKYPFYVLEEELTFYRRHDSNISKPSIEVGVRDKNDYERIYLEVFQKLDKEAFFKTFYEKCAYHRFETEEELLAAKYILLVNTHNRIYEQIALEIYYEQCENQRFFDILEKKYNYKFKNFVFLSGNGGLQYYLLDALNQTRYTALEEDDFTPAHILVNAIETQKLDAYSIREYAYSTLMDVLVKVENLEYFYSIKDKVNIFRNKYFEHQTQKNIVFMVGQDTEFDIFAYFSDIINDKNHNCYFAEVPKKDTIFAKEAVDFKPKTIEGIENLSLYDEKDHCLKFLSEAGVVADVIYYIDCISSEYSCAEMMAGYSLATEMNCVIRNNDAEHIQNDMGKVLELFDKIYTY